MTIKDVVLWCKGSGATVTVRLNPFKWLWKVWFRLLPRDLYADEWFEGDELKGVQIGFLFLYVELWIDKEMEW